MLQYILMKNYIPIMVLLGLRVDFWEKYEMA